VNLQYALDILLIGAIAFAGYWLKKLDKSVDSYAVEKGKNLATREDIEGITRKIESVKAELTLESEVRRQAGRKR
jgi:hypothetical protein